MKVELSVAGVDLVAAMSAPWGRQDWPSGVRQELARETATEGLPGTDSPAIRLSY